MRNRIGTHKRSRNGELPAVLQNHNSKAAFPWGHGSMDSRHGLRSDMYAPKAEDGQDLRGYILQSLAHSGQASFMGTSYWAMHSPHSN